MRRESKRNCPFCDAKGITKQGVCEICRGTKQIVIRYDKGEAEIDDTEVFDVVCKVIREDIKLK